MKSLQHWIWIGGGVVVLSGASMQTMSTCISCHEHCRDVLRIAELPKPMNRVVPIPATEEEVSWNSMPTLRR